jgi:hypothetical protein
MLYMFQAVPQPIIRSSKAYTQHLVFVELFLLLTAIVGKFQLTHDKYPMLFIQFCAPDDGRRNRLNLVEHLQ